MFQYITDKIRGRRKRLLHDYIAIFIIMGMVLLLSFLIIGYIANSTTMEQSRNSSRVIYKQAREQLEQVEEDLRARGLAQVKSDEVGRAILKPLRDLDEVAYMRFASVYQNFENLEDFQNAIDELKADALK